MDAKFWIELIAALSIPAAVISVIYHRVQRKMGIGYRAIQFVAVPVVAALVLILALERLLEGQTLAALVGAFVGYLLSGKGIRATDSSGD